MSRDQTRVDVAESPMHSSLVVPWVRRSLVLLAAAWCVAYGLERVWSFTIDDAGISFAYAKHLARGEGLVAVAGGPTIEGYSNPLWVFLLAPLTYLDSFLVAAKLLAATLLCAAAALGMSACARMDDRAGWDWTFSDVGFVAVMALTPQFVVWVPSGLENALFGFLVLCLTVLDIREARRPSVFPHSSIAAFAVCITRPEGVLYAGAFGAVKLAHAAVRRPHLRQAGLYAATLACSLVAYHAWHYATFGEWVPNTYFAKPRTAEAAKAAWEYLEGQGAQYGHPLSYVIPIAAVGVIRHVRLKLGAVGVLGAAASFLFYSGGDWMPHGRFISFGIPPLAVLTAAGLQNLELAIRQVLGHRIPRHWLSLALTTAATYFWFGAQRPALKKIERRGWCHLCERMNDVRGMKRVQRSLGVPSASFVTHDFGGPAWLSDSTLYPLDMLGLCDHAVGRAWAGRKEGRFREFDWTRYQYLFHEQGHAPSFVYFPGHFWRGFTDSHEYALGYYRLANSRLGGSRRRDAVFAAHRSLFIDYLPELSSFEFRPLDSRLTLVGAGVDGSMQAGGEVTVRVALLRGQKRPTNVELGVRLSGSGKPTSTQKLFPSGMGLLKRWQTGEPRELEWKVAVPSGLTGETQVELGVRRGDHFRYHEIAKVEAGASYEVASSPSDYPSNLPAARSRALQRLEHRVTSLLHRRFGADGQRTRDVKLADELAEHGRRLESEGQDEQAYLAYVLATQADRSRLPDLHRKVARLRPLWSNADFVREMTLLRRAYASGAPEWFARSVAVLAARGEWDEAVYLMSRVVARATADWSPLMESLRARRLDASVERWLPRPLPGVESDFEAGASDGWTAEGSLAKINYEVPREAKPALRGFRGTSVMSSLSGKGRQGRARSATFTLNGGVLGLFVAGTRGAGTIELRVEGHVEKRIQPPRSNFMKYHLIDVAAYAGKPMQVVVTARGSSRRRYLAADDFHVFD